MKVEIYYEIDEYDDTESQDMYVAYEDDKKISLSVYPLCERPEDAIIGRSLISCDKIFSLMKIAYEAGKNGEDLIVEKHKNNEDL